jgi:hypothetical protein
MAQFESDAAIFKEDLEANKTQIKLDNDLS